MREETYIREVQDPSSWGQMARVWYNLEADEYRVTFFKGGLYVEDADYFTSDYDDALATAKAQVEQRWS